MTPGRISYTDAQQDQVRFIHLDYAAHGQPNMIRSPGGKYVFMDYLDANLADTTGESQGEDGMLGAVEISRSDNAALARTRQASPQNRAGHRCKLL